MDKKLVDEIIYCLPQGKTHYRYFKGAYASKLLSMLLPRTASISILNKSRFKNLLDHQTLKQVVANAGDGMLCQDKVKGIWQEPSLPFLLSVSRWGGTSDRGWQQTSRFGENLVLQLNLPNQHIQNYKKWVDADWNDTLNGRWSCHPVQKPDNNAMFRDTLAWSRIDVDFTHNEALIEEIQTDAVRNIKDNADYYKNCMCQQCKIKMNYVQWFSHYTKVWAEAMLMATIWFIYQELGINRLFMHTARSGWQVKKMSKTWQPPRSIYTDLPRKFAFKQTWAAPEFLLRERCYQQLIRRQPDIDFYQLSMNELKTINL